MLTFFCFKVGSILDFDHSGFFPCGILSNFVRLEFCSLGILSNSGFCLIWKFVKFEVLSNSRFCPIRDFVHSGFCPNRNFRPFGILSNSGFCTICNFVPFGILFFWILCRILSRQSINLASYALLDRKPTSILTHESILISNCAASRAKMA